MEIYNKLRESAPCPDTPLLAKYISGAASDQEKDRIEIHLAMCDECLEYVAIAGQIVNEAVTVEYESAPEEAAAVIRKIQNASPNAAKKNRHGMLNMIQNFFQYLIQFVTPMQPAFQRSASDICGQSFALIKNFDDFQIQVSADIQESRLADITVTISGAIRNIVRLTLENKDLTYDDSRPVKGNSEQFCRLPFDGYWLSFNLKETQEQRFGFRIDDKGIHEA